MAIFYVRVDLFESLYCELAAFNRISRDSTQKVVFSVEVFDSDVVFMHEHHWAPQINPSSTCISLTSTLKFLDAAPSAGLFSKCHASNEKNVGTL